MPAVSMLANIMKSYITYRKTQTDTGIPPTQILADGQSAFCAIGDSKNLNDVFGVVPFIPPATFHYVRAYDGNPVIYPDPVPPSGSAIFQCEKIVLRLVGYGALANPEESASKILIRIYSNFNYSEDDPNVFLSGHSFLAIEDNLTDLKYHYSFSISPANALPFHNQTLYVVMQPENFLCGAIGVYIQNNTGFAIMVGAKVYMNYVAKT